jgi:hypothetical protein
MWQQDRNYNVINFNCSHLQRVQYLLLNGRHPLVPLLGVAGLEVPLFVIKRDNEELIAVRICNDRIFMLLKVLPT